MVTDPRDIQKQEIQDKIAELQKLRQEIVDKKPKDIEELRSLGRQVQGFNSEIRSLKRRSQQLSQQQATQKAKAARSDPEDVAFKQEERQQAQQQVQQEKALKETGLTQNEEQVRGLFVALRQRESVADQQRFEQQLSSELRQGKELKFIKTTDQGVEVGLRERPQDVMSQANQTFSPQPKVIPQRKPQTFTDLLTQTQTQTFQKIKTKAEEFSRTQKEKDTVTKEKVFTFIDEKKEEAIRRIETGALKDLDGNKTPVRKEIELTASIMSTGAIEGGAFIFKSGFNLLQITKQSIVNQPKNLFSLPTKIQTIQEKSKQTQDFIKLQVNPFQGFKQAQTTEERQFIIHRGLSQPSVKITFFIEEVLRSPEKRTQIKERAELTGTFIVGTTAVVAAQNIKKDPSIIPKKAGKLIIETVALEPGARLFQSTGKKILLYSEDFFERVALKHELRKARIAGPTGFFAPKFEEVIIPKISIGKSGLIKEGFETRFVAVPQGQRTLKGEFISDEEISLLTAQLRRERTISSTIEFNEANGVKELVNIEPNLFKIDQTQPLPKGLVFKPEKVGRQTELIPSQVVGILESGRTVIFKNPETLTKTIGKVDFGENIINIVTIPPQGVKQQLESVFKRGQIKFKFFDTKAQQPLPSTSLPGEFPLVLKSQTPKTFEQLIRDKNILRNIRKSEIEDDLLEIKTNQKQTSKKKKKKEEVLQTSGNFGDLVVIPKTSDSNLFEEGIVISSQKNVQGAKRFVEQLPNPQIITNQKTPLISSLSITGPITLLSNNKNNLFSKKPITILTNEQSPISESLNETLDISVSKQTPIQITIPDSATIQIPKITQQRKIQRQQITQSSQSIFFPKLPIVRLRPPGKPPSPPKQPPKKPPSRLFDFKLKPFEEEDKKKKKKKEKRGRVGFAPTLFSSLINLSAPLKGIPRGLTGLEIREKVGKGKEKKRKRRGIFR